MIGNFSLFLFPFEWVYSHRILYIPTEFHPNVIFFKLESPLLFTLSYFFATKTYLWKEMLILKKYKLKIIWDQDIMIIINIKHRELNFDNY